jgi:hypothetical protein
MLFYLLLVKPPILALNGWRAAENTPGGADAGAGPHTVQPQNGQ